MDIPVLKFIFISSMILVASISYGENTNNRSEENVESKSIVLSRKKRFLTFPDGSSFQLGNYITYITFIIPKFNLYLFFNKKCEEIKSTQNTEITFNHSEAKDFLLQKHHFTKFNKFYTSIHVCF